MSEDLNIDRGFPKVELIFKIYNKSGEVKETLGFQKSLKHDKYKSMSSICVFMTNVVNKYIKEGKL